MIRILVADDHPVLRDGIAAMLENQEDMELVGEAADGSEAVERFRSLRPDVVLMDLQMPGIDGLEAITSIRAEDPNARILVLTTFAGDVQAVRALKAGATGYLLKNSLRTEMLSAIRSVSKGVRHIHREVADGIAHHVADETLTEREISVLKLIAFGRGNKQVAHELGVSEETVKAHLKVIYEKLHVSDRTHAITVANQRGIFLL
ncbi:response regulator transcription factor [Novosphingobium sp.]|uniref:response regulator transcription factor n=1 Tax=Novosphingobium sp. TaxID=1874826 RepID=UPI003D6D0649